MQKLFANISLVVFLNALVKPLWVLMENVVHNRVGHEDWGMYTALFSFAFLFLTLCDLGVNQYTAKTLATQPQLLKSYFPNLLSFKLSMLIVYPLLMMGAGWLWGYRDEWLYFLALLSLMHAGNQLLQFFRANFQAMQRFRLDGVATVMDKLILLVLVGALLFIGIDLQSFVSARLVATGLAALILYGMIMGLYGWMLPKLSMNKLMPLIKASLPFALITVLYSFHDKVDQVMLERIAGEMETGYYAGAYRWLDVFSMYMWITLSIFFARFAFFIDNTVEKNKLIRLGQIVIALPLLFSSLLVYFYGEVFLVFFTNSSPEELEIMGQSLKILFIALSINALCIIYSTLLTATGHERFVNQALVVGICLNVGLNLYLIPIYGAIGAAWATVVSFGLIGVSYIGYVQVRLPEQVAWGVLLRIGLATSLLFIIWSQLAKTRLTWYEVSIFCASIFAGICWMLGLFSRRFFTD